MVVYVILSIAWLQLSGMRFGFSKGKFLYDSCKYNYGDVCTRGERPNAKICPDYKKK